MKVYISCSSEDSEVYKDLAKKLKAQGDRVINEELPANSEGQEDNTAERIKEADIVIAIISENFIQSPTAQVELGYALIDMNNKREKTSDAHNDRLNVESQSPLDKSPDESDNKPDRKFKPIYGIAIALFFALIAIGISLLMNRNHSSQDTPINAEVIETEPKEEAEANEAETRQAATEQAATEQIAGENTATTEADMSRETAAVEEQPLEREDEIKDEPEEEAEINQEAVDNTVHVEVDIPSDAVTFEGHSYYIFDNGRASWNEAKEFCESQGGYLAVISSSEENEFLYDYMIKAGFDEVFFGYTDQYNEGRWEWVSDKTSDYTDWGTNSSGSMQPNADSSYEDYAHMNSAMHDGHWNDKRFGKVTSCYFCEWDLIDYQEKDYNGKVAENEVPLRNDASNEADIIMKLKQNEEVQILFLLTDDDGDQWYYVQNKAELYGYIESELLKID